MSGKQENQKTNPTSSDINLLQQKNGLDLGVHLTVYVVPDTNTGDECISK
jgi:hypothetical protein